MKKETKTLFRVESVVWSGGRCPVRKTFTFQYGYFTTLKKAEQSIPYTGYTDEVLFYIITEILLDRGDIDWNEVCAVRTYNPDGMLIDETKADVKGVWHGRNQDKRLHKVGDVVEVFSYFTQVARLGIIAQLPNTVEEVETFHKNYDGVGLTIDDDMYGIIYLDGNFKHEHSYSVLKPIRPVPEHLKKALEEILRHYDSNQPTQLEKVAGFVSRLKNV